MMSTANMAPEPRQNCAAHAEHVPECAMCRAMLAHGIASGSAHRAHDEIRREALQADAERQMRRITGAGPYRSASPGPYGRAGSAFDEEAYYCVACKDNGCSECAGQVPEDDSRGRCWVCGTNLTNTTGWRLSEPSRTKLECPDPANHLRRVGKEK